MDIPTGYIGTLGIDEEMATRILDSWPDKDDERASVSSICQLIKENDADWPTAVTIDERLAGGIYTPLQLLTLKAAEKTSDQIKAEYPFLFSLIGLSSTTYLAQLRSDSPLSSWPPDFDGARRLLQTIFQLREMREEREPLSLEVMVPEETSTKTPVDIKKLAQVFGRGVAQSHGSALARVPDTEGRVLEVFRTHEKAPSSRLYHLESVFNHVDRDQLSLSVRRDGHVTIATQENPLYEFYDGGWHVVDLKAAGGALSRILDVRFPDHTIGDSVAALLNLAYHMATHWHSGILGVVAEPELRDGEQSILEPQSEESTKTTKAIEEQLESHAGLTITEIVSNGFGRVLLTNAIQDGATIFTPDGCYHSSTRMVRLPRAMQVGGAGTRAARGLAAHGVAIKISKDGGIRVFAEKDGRSLVPPAGLRVH
jgi:hypothetical protein